MDPKFYLILSYPSLRTHKLGVLPHRNALVWEAEPGKLLLAGAQATGVTPKVRPHPSEGVQNFRHTVNPPRSAQRHG